MASVRNSGVSAQRELTVLVTLSVIRTEHDFFFIKVSLSAAFDCTDGFRPIKTSLQTKALDDSAFTVI